MLQEYPDAIAAYEKAVDLEAEFWPGVNNIGLVKYEQGNIAEAIEYWEESIVIEPEAAEPLLAIAVARFIQGQEQEALKMGEAALELDRKYAELDFLEQNLWGDRLLRDAQQFLQTPQIQAFLSQFPG